MPDLLKALSVPYSASAWRRRNGQACRTIHLLPVLLTCEARYGISLSKPAGQEEELRNRYLYRGKEEICSHMSAKGWRIKLVKGMKAF